MIAHRRCPKGSHKVLLVEQWTAMGAVVSCLDCNSTLHVEEPTLAADYIGFEHIAVPPEVDRAVYIRASYLEGDDAKTPILSDSIR